MTMTRDQAYHYRWGKGCDGWVFVARDDLLVIEERMPPGTSEHRHRHERARQFFQVKAGALVIEVEGSVHTLAPGDGLEIAPGERHQVMNQGSADAWFINVSSPSAHGDRVNDDGVADEAPDHGDQPE